MCGFPTSCLEIQLLALVGLDVMVSVECMQSWPALVLWLLASNSTHSIGQLSSTAPTENAPVPPVFVFNENLMISRELIETHLKIFPIIATTSANLTTDETSPLQQPSQTQQNPKKSPNCSHLCQLSCSSPPPMLSIPLRKVTNSRSY